MSTTLKPIICLFFVALVISSFHDLAQSQGISSGNEISIGESWKAGVANARITPKENMWMSGYAAREKPADGTLHDLWVKALALEDQNGNRSVFITSDLIGLSRDVSHSICDQIQKNQQLKRSQIIISSSHTHSGPVINSNLKLIYPEFNEEQLNQISAYRTFLEKTVIQCVDDAFNNIGPVRLSSGTGIARFAVNRRNNTPDEVLHSNDLQGPSDYSVPVFSVHSATGELKTLLFGYACHCTTLSNNQWNGDYAGFAQLELEKKYPGCTAMFYASCGGDQNPEPRGLIEQAEQYGTELAAAVTRVLKGPMNELNPDLQTNYGEIELPFSEPYSEEEFREVIVDAPEWQKRWAHHYLSKIEKGDKLQQSYRHYPVQSWQIGEQTMISLGGEVVVDYAIRLKKTWGNDLFIAAYSNDVMAYIPSERVLAEGGYEGNTSMRAYGQPSTWAPGIEDKIVKEVDRQLEILGIKRRAH